MAKSDSHKIPKWLNLEDGEEYVRPLWRKPTPLGLFFHLIYLAAFLSLLAKPYASVADNLTFLKLPIGLLIIAVLIAIPFLVNFYIPAGHLTTRRLYGCFGIGSKAFEIRLEKVTGAIPDFFPSVSSLFNWLDVYYLDEHNKQTQRGFEIRQQGEISELIIHLAVKEKLRLGDHIGASMLLGREDFLYEPREAANGQK